MGESGDQAVDFSVDNLFSSSTNLWIGWGSSKRRWSDIRWAALVSLGTAIRYPEKVVKVIVIGSPIVGSSLRPLIKLAGRRTWMDLAETSPALFDVFMSGLRVSLRGYSYLLAKDGKALGNMFANDLSKLTMGRSLKVSLHCETDLRPRMGEVRFNTRHLRQ